MHNSQTELPYANTGGKWDWPSHSHAVCEPHHGALLAATGSRKQGYINLGLIEEDILAFVRLSLPLLTLMSYIFFIGWP